MPPPDRRTSRLRNVLRGRRRGRTSLGYDLAERLSPTRCAVCALALRSLDRFFYHLSYENTNDFDTRERFVHGGGFCRDHAWRYVEVMNDGLSVALLYEHLLKVAERQGQMHVGGRCVACEYRATAERDLTTSLA